jgi:hypothetical protein
MNSEKSKKFETLYPQLGKLKKIDGGKITYTASYVKELKDYLNNQNSNI